MTMMAMMGVRFIFLIPIQAAPEFSDSSRTEALRDRLRMVVAARCRMIQARDVDPREPRPDGRHCPQDQAVSD
jgi:hypothetical protein